MYFAYLFYNNDNQPVPSMLDMKSTVCYIISDEEDRILYIYNEDVSDRLSDATEEEVIDTFSFEQLPSSYITLEVAHYDFHKPDELITKITNLLQSYSYANIASDIVEVIDEGTDNTIYYNINKILKDNNSDIIEAVTDTVFQKDHYKIYHPIHFDDPIEDGYNFNIADAVFSNYPDISSIDLVQQNEETYERRKNRINEYATQEELPCKLIFKGNKYKDLIYPIMRYEQLCAIQTRTINHIDVLMKARIHGLQKNGITDPVETGRAWFNLAAKRTITTKSIFKNNTSDARRTLFIGVGEYIKSQLVKSNSSGRYYFPPEYDEKFILDMRHVMKFALSQGAVMEVPLGHGIIYGIQTGLSGSGDSLSLHELMYLFRLDYGVDKLIEALRHATGDLKDLSKQQPVRGFAGKLQSNNMLHDNDRLTWLYRYLHEHVYKGAYTAMDIFLHKGNDKWDDPSMSRAIKYSSITHLADAFGKIK